MRWMYKLRLRVRSLFGRRGVERELSEEVQFHLEKLVEEKRAKGMSAEEARHAAMREFGGVEQVKEECRDARGVRFLETLWLDLLYGLRMLSKSPGFTIVAVLTLALGIGANSAIFSLIDSLMLRSLPVRDPGGLVELLHQAPGSPRFNGFSWAAYRLFRNKDDVFSGLLAEIDRRFEVRSGNSRSQKVNGAYVNASYFSLLGLKPAIGRLIGPEDDQRNNPPAAAVISWSYWNTHFHSAPSVLGKQILVRNVAYTVIGVAPRGFSGLHEQARQEVWLPLAMHPEAVPFRPAWRALLLVGRLRPGVSMKQARSELAVLYSSIVDEVAKAKDFPFARKFRFEMEPAGDGLTSVLRQQYADSLLALMALVGVLLLLACANVAGLLLARGAARQREMALRAALGAGRLRLLRQAFVESLLVAAAGSLAGIGLAYFGASALVHILLSGRQLPGMPSDFKISVHPDAHVLLFTVLIGVIAALLSGLAPALRSFAAQPASMLRPMGTVGESRKGRLFGKSLVTTEVALSVLLLSAAGLFIGYLWNLEHLHTGFRRDHLLLITLDPTHSGYSNEQLSQLYQELLGRLERIPGVRSATLSGTTPVSGAGANRGITVEGHRPKPGTAWYVMENWVAPDYFETYGTPILAGRDFSQPDRNGAPVVIINQAAARYFFGHQDPIGEHVRFDGDAKPYEIVGVVGNAKYLDLVSPAPRTIYLDAFQDDSAFSQFTLWTSVRPEAVAPEARQIVHALLRTVPVKKVTTMGNQEDASVVPQRLVATLSEWFATLGALLAGIGIFGLLAYTVTRRVNEIGIRIALGATRGEIAWMVLRDALWMVVAGLALGAPLAIWAGQFAASLIEGIRVTGAFPIATGAAAIIAVALLAAYLPARRAARVDPITALRHE